MNQYTREELWQVLDQLSPLSLAGSWDNVGVLLESLPNQSVKQLKDEKILLTIDLSESVFEEALVHQCTVIITYHPIIFGGLKRLTLANPKCRTLLRAAQAGIAIYSPHTALDAVHNGVCDWLAYCALIAETKLDKPNFVGQIIDLCMSYTPIEINPVDPQQGSGRICTLKETCSLEIICKNLDLSLNQGLSPQQNKTYLRLATPHGYCSTNAQIKSIALCPGAGGSLFKSVPEADLLITGEMSHHDILAQIEKGTVVILTEHTRCERGFLSYYKKHLMDSLSVPVVLAESDDDPMYLYQS